MDKQLEQDIKTLQDCLVSRFGDTVDPSFSPEPADELQGGPREAAALGRCLDRLRLLVGRRQQLRCQHRMRPTPEGSRSRRYGWVKECFKCGLKVKALKRPGV
jgi:hypothetical protein